MTSRCRSSSPRPRRSPRPWIRPKTPAISQRRPTPAGATRFSTATQTIEAAISGSTIDDGTSTTPSAARLKVMLWATVKAVTIFTVCQRLVASASSASQEQQMVDAADDVLDTEAKIENELACRSALRRRLACYGNARLALALFEYHLPGAARPLDVGDRVMVDAEQGVDAVANREIAYRRRAGIEHHDLNARAPGRRRPRLGRDSRSKPHRRLR